MLIGSGCGVPGVMASRTIENERDRRMTVMTTCFVPCGAKMPIIGLFAGALFGGSGLVAVSAYFIGVAAIIFSGIILKKTKAFAGDPAPFVMELPAYHVPSVGNVLRATWERGWSFIKRAGTIILASSIILWFLQGFGFTEAGFGMVEDNNTSLLAAIGGAVAASAGAAFLCYVTPAEHLRLPDAADVREGLVATKIAAHAADIARGVPGARDRDNRMSDARRRVDWEGMFAEALDPVKARRYFESAPPSTDGTCTMCGEMCAMRTVNTIMDGLTVDLGKE